MHDIAEGLSYLHDQNVLHRNITSSAIYLKGSVQCLVLRAAVGDFEDAQIYGTLLTGSPSSNITRKRFFFPDIRAYALVGIEMLSRICECRQREKQPHRRTAIKVSSGLKGSHEQIKNHNRPHDHNSHQRHHHHQHHHHSQDAYGVDKATEASRNGRAIAVNHLGVVRYETQEMPYNVPGEAERIPRGKSLARKGRIMNAKSPGTNQSSPPAHSRPTSPNTNSGEQMDMKQLDPNWMLQARSGMPSTTSKQGDDTASLCEEYTACDSDRFNHSQAPGVTYVKNGHKFEFPNSSVFKSVNDEFGEDLDMIEEEIERNTSILHGVKNKNYKQGGYVTSKTEDGREIFIPAIYKAKSSGANSSSGYGSASDIYNNGNTTSGKPSSADQSQSSVYKTTSAATISSFEDDILEVLPGMTEVDEKARKGDHMLRELLKAKKDAKVEMLIESYEERVRRGELRPDLEGLPIGVVFPKKNRQGAMTGAGENVNLPDQIEEELQLYDNLETRVGVKPQISKLDSPRPKTAHGSMNEHFHRRAFRPMSASNSSFSAWNARSSLKRNKARHALKRALSGKGTRNMQWHKPESDRGTRGKEVEMKYAGRAGVTKSPEVNIQNTSQVEVTSNVQGPNPATEKDSENKLSSPLSAKMNTARGNPEKVAHVSPTLVKPVASRVTRKPSNKSRPAPPPPTTSPREQKSIIHNPTSYAGSVTITAMNSKDQPLPQLDINDSSTSANPESSVSGSIDTSQNTDSVAPSEHVMNITTQIETDMNNIIQGNSPDIVSGIPLSPGIRLLESGFDSASVSSEESCLCAAAALQAVEEGYSCTSEAFSQGACSCACSNCIQDSQMYNKGSSWTGSQDSESWSNSNSLSSYDTNMHRRKISSRKHESTGCVLAPDEQYPSPGRRHRNLMSSNNLHPRHAYSPKRNRRRLGHTKGTYPSSASETSSAASRRYRELIKKGVPLRVSVVSGDDETADEGDTTKSIPTQIDSTNEKKDDALYSNLDDRGFFDSGPEMRNIHPMPIHSTTSKEDFEEDDDDEDHYCQLSTIPSLEEIIKEIPDETGHYPEEARAFLNRPESDMSVKALQAVLSRHGSTTDGKQIQDAELIIDRIFSQHPGSSSNVTPGVSLHTGIELDDAAIREIAMLPNGNSDPHDICDIAGLLSGMDGSHIRYCHSISSRVHLVNLKELLPANSQAFDQLKTRLQISGAMGIIGNQLLDLIRLCWLNDTPPSTASIVDQLTDHITETEL